MRNRRSKSIPDRSRPGSTTTALSIDFPQDGSDKRATGGKRRIKLLSKETTIGTWNVRTLQSCGKLEELEHELKGYRWDILGLSEVRFTGFGEMTTDEGHKMWYSGHDTLHRQGVAFLVHKDKTASIISCTPISSRLISIRVAAQPFNVSIIQVYAPTSDYDDEDVEEFYEQIEDIIERRH